MTTFSAADSALGYLYQIATIAGTRGLILVTRNVSDFGRFNGLLLENWFDPAP
jgi:predicted nucleic acid-binding protein